MKLTQCQRILKTMILNDKDIWFAKDFQSGDNFIGYEASARLSELKNKYIDLFEVVMDGKFRGLKINRDKITNEILEEIGL